ncbi:hypothetical protein FJU08_02000 [Martelella alba]|uniref:YrhK domain-containing protein n=1 Tax=Martelella alba TaxID=2590451 RepID=A0A506UJ61_9HYPH|nr:hypothetical protein [Martelella alba]TPW33357.1 hypothetical protein FJU08_02000 [Martelella alba]
MADRNGRESPHRSVETGPWPFITLRLYQHGGRHFDWRARDHRKGLFRQRRGLEHVHAPIWQRAFYNWLTGLVFVIGATLFMTGSAMALFPAIVAGLPAWTTNATFFAGSIPFTTAAYLQLFQAANADEKHTSGKVPPALFGRDIKSPGWLSASTQFIGTIAFNFNTFDTIIAPSHWGIQDLVIWLPGMIGSVLFLVSGYLAYIEVGHAHMSLPKRDLSWWIAAINLLGCITFMIASTLAYIPARPEAPWIMALSNANLWFGAFCFFVGAALSMREARNAAR